MNDYEAKVRQFHEVMGVAVSDTPTLADKATRELRCRLLLEEVLEVCRASGVDVFALNPLLQSGKDLVVKAEEYDPVDVAALAQELADVCYIAAGTAVTHGIPLGAVFDEVHAANMRKVGPDGSVVRRPDGKVVKPAGWCGPDVARVLAECAGVKP